MDHEFWLDKWQRNEIGFHLDEVNSSLVVAWPQLGVESGRILVPLCGKSVDMLWLLHQGLDVVGIELSPLALEALRTTIADHLGWEFTRTERDGVVVYEHDRVLLIEGDLFAVKPETCGEITAVYDRAAMVALPAAMRDRYRQHILTVSNAAPQLLITLDYDQSVAGGPPFAVSDAEVRKALERHFTIRCQDERELIDQEPRFKAKGLTSFVQRTYLLTPLA